MPYGDARKSVRASTGPTALYFVHADGILMRRQKGSATRFLRSDGENPGATRSIQTEICQIDNIHYVKSDAVTVHVDRVHCDAKNLHLRVSFNGISDRVHFLRHSALGGCGHRNARRSLIVDDDGDVLDRKCCFQAGSLHMPCHRMMRTIFEGPENLWSLANHEKRLRMAPAPAVSNIVYSVTSV
jgi:hypothetical protein